MDKKTLEFEKIFAKQMTFLEEKDFPEGIVAGLWNKKAALLKKVKAYEIMPTFVPIIPEAYLTCIQQVLRFVFFSHSEKNENIMSSTYLHGFFGSMGNACDLSQLSEPGFIIDVRCKKISEMTIPYKADTKLLDRFLREKISEEGFIPANHVESFAVACMTDLLPSDGSKRFCAVNFSWDGYAFASVFPGNELKYGLGWLHPTYKFDGTYRQDERDKYEVLVPMFKEFV